MQGVPESNLTKGWTDEQKAHHRKLIAEDRKGKIHFPYSVKFEDADESIKILFDQSLTNIEAEDPINVGAVNIVDVLESTDKKRVTGHLLKLKDTTDDIRLNTLSLIERSYKWFDKTGPNSFVVQLHNLQNKHIWAAVLEPGYILKAFEAHQIKKKQDLSNSKILSFLVIFIGLPLIYYFCLSSESSVNMPPFNMLKIALGTLITRSVINFNYLTYKAHVDPFTPTLEKALSNLIVQWYGFYDYKVLLENPVLKVDQTRDDYVKESLATHNKYRNKDLWRVNNDGTVITKTYQDNELYFKVERIDEDIIDDIQQAPKWVKNINPSRIGYLSDGYHNGSFMIYHIFIEYSDEKLSYIENLLNIHSYFPTVDIAKYGHVDTLETKENLNNKT